MSQLVESGVNVSGRWSAVIALIPIIVHPPDSTLSKVQTITVIVLCTVFGLAIFFGAIVLLCSLVAFSANVIQFGMDQLHDAPSDDSVLYIHWYVWTSYAGLLLVRVLVVSFNQYNIVLLVYCLLLIPLALIFLGISLCVQRYKCHWFLIESDSRNPYKLVFYVIKFASNHSNPIQRSAFTYYENELPSGLDLGKEKYGGPFTTEEVENVKALWEFCTFC